MPRSYSQSSCTGQTCHFRVIQPDWVAYVPLMWVLAIAVLCAAPAASSVTAQQLTGRATATQRALQQTGARWTMRRVLGKAVDLGVRVTRFGPDTQWELLAIEGGKVNVLRTITEVGEVHVSRRPGQPPEVTRRWEEVLDSQWSVLISRATPGFFHANGAEHLLEGVEAGYLPGARPFTFNVLGVGRRLP